MIESVKLKNFQSHKENTFSFTKGVNAIVGPSDSGKTAILRALRWLIWNRPLGDAFRSDWGGDTEVTVTVDGQLITRYKHDNKHGYKIGKIDLKAIGTDVPEEVSTILNIDEINLQQQFDKPFLLADSPGEVAQHFNKVAHLENIDRAIKLLNGWYRKLNQDAQAHTEKLAEYRHALNEFDYISAMEMMLETAEELQQQKEQQEAAIDKLLKLIDDLESIEIELAELTPLMAFDKLIKKYEGLSSERKVLLQRKNALYALKNELEDTSYRLEKLHSSTPAETGLNEALELYAEHKKLKTDVNRMVDLLNEIKYVVQVNSKTIKEVEQLQKEYHENFPDVCPLCGSKKKGTTQ